MPALANDALLSSADTPAMVMTSWTAGSLRAIAAIWSRLCWVRDSDAASGS
jgi:hypothetical protein